MEQVADKYRFFSAAPAPAPELGEAEEDWEEVGEPAPTVNRSTPGRQAAPTPIRPGVEADSGNDWEELEPDPVDRFIEKGLNRPKYAAIPRIMPIYGAGKFRALMTTLSGGFILAIALLMWYGGAIFTVEFLARIFKMADRPWFLWIAPVGFTIIELGALPWVGRHPTITKIWLGCTGLDTLTTMVPATIWMAANVAFCDNLLIGGPLGFAYGQGLALGPEPVLLVGWMLLSNGFVMLFRPGGDY